jgi:hypothetical protein
MRATIEYHYHPSDADEQINLPPIDVVIVDSEDEVNIKISDSGGGISRKDLSMIFTYTYTTTVPPHLLPLVRLNARESLQQQDLSSSPTQHHQATNSNNSSTGNIAIYGSDVSTEDTEDLPIVYQSNWLDAHLQEQQQQQQQSSSDDTGGQASSISPGSAMFGDAFGLPLARLYARTLGGDVKVYSLKSYGTDSYITCRKISANSDTPLPE